MSKLQTVLGIVMLCSFGFPNYQVEWSLSPFDPNQSSVFSQDAADYDVDGDGVPNVVVADGGKFMVLSGSGSVVWSEDVPSPFVVWVDVDSPFHIANTDNDANKELVLEVYYWNGSSSHYKFLVYDCVTHALDYVSPDMNSRGTVTNICTVTDVDDDGMSEICVLAGYPSRTLNVYGWTSALDEGAVVPGRRGRSTAVPSPAHGVVRFSIPRAADGEFGIVIADMAGRIVRSLRSAGRAGLNLVVWDCRDDSGQEVPCGTYVYSAGEATGRLEVVR